MIAVDQITFRNVPLTTRFKAWWEGYSVETLQEQKKKVRRTSAQPINAGLAEKPAPTTLGEITRPTETWNRSAVEASQLVWGKGFCGPNDAAFLEQLTEQIDIKPNTSLLQLGAQLGGQAKMLADGYDVNVRGLEASAALVEFGAQSDDNEKAPAKTRISLYNPESFTGFSSKFENVISQEALFTVEGKRDLLSQIEDQLRSGGRIALSEFMLESSAAIGKDTYQQWVAKERSKPYPISLEEMKDILTDLKLEIHITEDISKRYQGMVKRAWSGVQALATRLAEKPEGVEKIRAIANEAELWQAREKIVDSGDIRMWRVVARKKPAIRMLSDW